MTDDDLTELECAIIQYCEDSGLFLGPTFSPIDAICFVECIPRSYHGVALILGVTAKAVDEIEFGFRQRSQPERAYDKDMYEMGKRLLARVQSGELGNTPCWRSWDMSEAEAELLIQALEGEIDESWSVFYRKDISSKRRKKMELRIQHCKSLIKKIQQLGWG